MRMSSSPLIVNSRRRAGRGGGGARDGMLLLARRRGLTKKSPARQKKGDPAPLVVLTQIRRPRKRGHRADPRNLPPARVANQRRDAGRAKRGKRFTVASSRRRAFHFFYLGTLNR